MHDALIVNGLHRLQHLLPVHAHIVLADRASVGLLKQSRQIDFAKLENHQQMAVLLLGRKELNDVGLAKEPLKQAHLVATIDNVILGQ